MSAGAEIVRWWVGDEVLLLNGWCEGPVETAEGGASELHVTTFITGSLGYPPRPGEANLRRTEADEGGHRGLLPNFVSLWVLFWRFAFVSEF